MAGNTNQSQQSYAETLREMRALRMQQLRQGSTQTQISSKHAAMLSSLNNIMSKQLQVVSRLESNQRASNQQLVSVNRNLNTLSTTLSRSLSNFAASVTRGAGQAGQGVSATGGAIANTASAAAAIATSVASGLSRVLPLAIAGLIAKAVTWDNMSEQTKDKLAGSMGRLFGKAFEEVDSTELGHSLTKVLTPAFQKIRALYKVLGEKTDAVKDRPSSDGDGEEEGSVFKLPKSVKKAEIKSRAQIDAARKTKERVSGLIPDEMPDAGTVIGTGVAVTAVAGAAEMANVRVGNIIKKPASKATQAAMELMKKHGLKGKDGLLAARVLRRASSGVGGAAKFLEAFTKYKLAAGGAFMILGGAIHWWEFDAVKSEIEQMAEEGIFDQKEVDYLVGRLKAENWGGVFTSAALSTLSMVGANVLTGGKIGAKGTAVVGAASGYYGNEIGSTAAGKAYDLINTRPESLNAEITPKSFSASDQAWSAYDERYDKSSGKRRRDADASGKPDAASTSRYEPGSNAEFVRNRAAREGVRHNPYVSPEYGNPSIGVGHKLTDREMKAGGVFIGGKLVKLDLSNPTPRGAAKETGPKQLTSEQIQQLAEQDHKAHENAARKMIGAEVFDKLTPDQQWALGDLSYAGGTGKNSAFADGKLKKMLAAGDEEGAANYISKWGLYYTVQSGGDKGKKVYTKNAARAAAGRAELFAGTKRIQDSDTRLADNSNNRADGSRADSSDETADGPDRGQHVISKPAETPEQKRRRQLTEMFQNTKAMFDPEKLKSDLLESLEIAKTVMMGDDSGGSNVTQIDNSVNNYAGSGSSAVSSGGKSPIPVMARNNLEHESMV